MSDEEKEDEGEKKYIELEMPLKVHLYKDAMFFRTGVGEAEGTLRDGRTFKIDIATNVSGGNPVLGVKIEGKDGDESVSYVLPWDSFIEAIMQDAEKRYPKKETV